MPDRELPPATMRFGQPEFAQVSFCPACGCRAVFRDLAQPGERERPVFLRCCGCGQERADLEFCELLP